MRSRLPLNFTLLRSRRLPWPVKNSNWACNSRRFNFSSSATSPEKPYYITTPIFYVNAEPHVGHLYTMVLTDILKRWQVLKGRTAIMSTGTDEHGMKIQRAAAAEDTPPKVFCDIGAKMFKRLASTSNISYDHFIRTTDPLHRDAVQYFWQMLQSRDYIYTNKHEGWYSISDETFYPESGVRTVLDPATGRKTTVSIETGGAVEWTSENNYHFRLSEMGPRLLKFYDKNPEFIVPQTRFKNVVDAVAEGLTDLSVSRPRERLAWGIPVPNDDSQTIYVWLDALVNYLTTSGYPWTPGQETARGWPADVQVIGKDIIRFHCIYWPAFLLALDIPPPKRILTHAHWTMNHRKMSKSVGNVVNPFFAMERYGIDTIRFYLAHDGGIKEDGDYSNEWIVERYRNSLQGGLGNLVNRVCGKAFDILKAIEQGVDGVKLGELDLGLRDVIETAAEKVTEKMEALDVPNALKEIMVVVHETNKYIQQSEPWRLQTPSEKSEQNKIIYLSTEGVRIAGILLQPFMPAKADELLDHLSVARDRRGIEFAGLGKDTKYGLETKGRRGMLFPPLSET